MFIFLISIAIAAATFLSNAEGIPHDFFVSVIEIRHQEGESEMTFRFRIFSDDLQAGLQGEFGFPQPPPVDAICDDPENHLYRFLKNHITIRINGEFKDETSTECSTEADVHEIIWHVNVVPTIETLEIRADYLMDVYPGQTQMVHITESGQRRTLRLTRQSPEGFIDFRN